MKSNWPQKTNVLGPSLIEVDGIRMAYEMGKAGSAIP